MLKMYCLRDMKAGMSAAPFVAENDIVVSRLLRETLRQGDSMMAKYPEDFQIHHIGDWDPDSGFLTPLEGARNLGSVSDLAPPPAEQSVSPVTPPVPL